MERSTFDASRGYDALAREYMLRRDPRIGVASVRRWAGELPRGGAVLDLGCGHGEPVSRVLSDAGLRVHGIDASPSMVAAFRERLPHAPVACEAVEHSRWFDRTFAGVIAWGLLFLLEEETQVALIRRVAAALEPGGRFLFTSPERASGWTDVLTGRASLSLGSDGYAAALTAAGFALVGEHRDEGGNHYFDARKR